MIRLSATDFGRALIQSGDLDPVYLMLGGAQLDRATLQRWCLAYWMFYHTGVASYLSEFEGSKFWDIVTSRLSGEWKFPRGTERRHFRGELAQRSVAYLRTRWDREPEMAAGSLDLRHNHHIGEVIPYTAIAREIKGWYGFGPWITFKIADMLDAVLGVPVDFTEGFPDNIFDDPAKGAVWSSTAYRFDVDVTRPGCNEYLEEERMAMLPDARRRRMVAAFNRMLDVARVEEWKPAHRSNGPVKLQEIETIFCKWKSHLNGHYPIGKDTHEIVLHLEGWGHVATKCRNVLLDRWSDASRTIEHLLE